MFLMVVHLVVHFPLKIDVFRYRKRILNVEQLAANDGMTLDDFVSWFFKTSNTFEGVIIHFTDFRY